MRRSRSRNRTRNKKNKRGGSGRSKRKRPNPVPRKKSRFVTEPLESPIDNKLMNEFPQSSNENKDFFENHGMLLGHAPVPDNMEIPEHLFHEINADPNIEHIKKLEEEYLKIREELERLKQKVYIDHQFQFDTIKRLMETRI